jgi:hypothetical protein
MLAGYAKEWAGYSWQVAALACQGLDSIYVTSVVCMIFARERWLQVSGLLPEQAVRSKEGYLPDSLL